MGLEAPLALLGLLAAVLPWLAHRILRRDLVPKPFPTLQLLRRAEAHKRRSRGLTDALLLALRIAVIVAASLALAAPYATAKLSFGDGRIASAVIVVDDSMSMTRRDGVSTLIERAIERSKQAIASLPSGSEVTLIAAGQPARVLLRHSRDLASVAPVLDRLADGSLRGPDLVSALRLAAEQVRAAHQNNRRVLVLSDFANHTGLTEENARIDGAELSLERVGSTPAPANVYFTSVRALPDPSVPTQTSIAVELAAYGEVPEQVKLSVQSSAGELARTSVALVQKRARTVIEVKTPAPDADPTALVRIEDSDAVEADNQAGVLLRSSAAVQVILVNGDPHPASERDELHYAVRALTAAGGEDGFMLRAVDEAALAKYDLAQADVVVLANVSAPDAATVERLTRFVRAGGGLLVAGGDHVEPRPYDAALSALLPCRIDARAQGPELGFAAAQPSSVIPAGPNGLEQARSRKRLMLDCEGNVLLRFSDRTPALAMTRVGRGRTAIMGVSLDTDSGDLPLRPGYLPLLARTIRELAGAGLAITGTVSAGSAVELTVPPEAERMEVVTPAGERVRFDALQGQTSQSFTQTDAPGAYRVLAAGAHGTLADVPRGAFVVEPPHADSDLTAIADLGSFHRGAVRADSASVVKQPLARYVLLLFALLALGEGLLRLRAR